MDEKVKTILAGILFGASAVLFIGGLEVASQPSVSPIASVIGAFIVPALLLWWGLILYRSAKRTT